MSTRLSARPPTLSTEEHGGPRITVLLVGDKTRPLALTEWLDPQHYEVHHIDSINEACTADPGEIDVVLLRVESAAVLQKNALQVALDRYYEAAVVVQTDGTDASIAEEVLLHGAQDCIDTSTCSRESMQRSIAHALMRTKAQRRMREHAIGLTQANTELNDFAHILAHDLRAPVRTSRLLGDRLLANVELNDPMVSDLGGRLKATLGRLDRSILAMLDYAAARSDLPVPSPVVLLPVATRTVENTLAGHDLNTSVADIAIDPSVSMLASNDLLGEVIERLLVNAIEFHPDKSALRLSLSAAEQGSRVTLTVKDNGNGIPMNARELVFQPMERLVSEPPGSGLGLAICRRIITGFGGSIWIDPKAEMGTSVQIDLPSARTREQS